MKEKISQRFEELIKEGQDLVQQLPMWNEDVYQSHIDCRKVYKYQSWLMSSVNLLHLIAKKDNPYLVECENLSEKGLYGNKGLSPSGFARMQGILLSSKEEWERGLLGEVEYIVAAETFDDFLDNAEQYHKANKHQESAILASAVLEDTIKKIALKNSVDFKGKSLDPIIDELVKSDIITQVKAKRIKAHIGVRNKADHANWDEFDIKDVGEMIKGIRELIEDYL